VRRDVGDHAEVLVAAAQLRPAAANAGTPAITSATSSASVRSAGWKEWPGAAPAAARRRATQPDQQDQQQRARLADQRQLEQVVSGACSG
jgi:hypothetical protein